MQGENRFDQFRGRFSIADGHSYKKWHKKLALAIIDFAQVNAYLTRRMVVNTSKDCDPFMTSRRVDIRKVVGRTWGLQNGVWGTLGASCAQGELNSASAMPSNRLILYKTTAYQVRRSKRWRGVTESVVSAWFAGENRYATEKTDYCGNHNVCLYRAVYQAKLWLSCAPTKTWRAGKSFTRFSFPSKAGKTEKPADLYNIKQAQNAQVKNAASEV
jgi:hypothetical protein